jgi:hypothetical protein
LVPPRICFQAGGLQETATRPGRKEQIAGDEVTN